MVVCKLSAHFRAQWPQIYSILAVCIHTVTLGQLLAWTSPYIPVLRDRGVSMEVASYLTMISPLMAIIVSPFVGKLIDCIGRRLALFSITFFYTISWVLIAIGAQYSNSASTVNTALYTFFAARMFNGIGDACTLAVIPCYVAEIATPTVRGTWGNCIALSISFGQFLINIIGAYLPIAHSAYINLLLLTGFAFNFFVLKESPYFLLMRGRVEDARSALQWLRGATSVEAELTQLTSDVQRQLSESGRYEDLIRIPTNRRACLIGVLIRGSQLFSGITPFVVYSQTIFQESGSNFSPSMSAIAFTGMLFLCSFLGSFVLERLGRRKAMLISSTGTCIVLFAQSAFFYIKEDTSISLEGFHMFPLISMIVYVIIFGVGLGLVPTLIMGELFSSSIKSKALVVMNIIFAISMAGSAKVFVFWLDFAGLHAAFLFHAVCSILSILISYFIVPETRGKTLEEIQQSLNHKTYKT